jgi:quinol monooxygenase YgiN
MISVFVKIPLKQGKVEEFTEAFKEIAIGVSKEEGNFLYSLNFAKDAPNTAIIMERYTDQDALTVHSQSDHYKVFGSKLGGMVAGAPDILFMDEVFAA